MTSNLAWVSIQTTGFRASDALPLSITVLITNVFGDELAKKHWCCHIDDDTELDQKILDMHGPLLLKCVDAEHDAKQVDFEVRNFIDRYGCGGVQSKPNGEVYRSPLVARSIDFTREWLKEHFPKTHGKFARENIDLKALAVLTNHNMPGATQDGPSDLDGLRLWYVQDVARPRLPAEQRKTSDRKAVYIRWHSNGLLQNVSLTQDGRSLRYVYKPESDAPAVSNKKR